MFMVHYEITQKNMLILIKLDDKHKVIGENLYIFSLLHLFLYAYNEWNFIIVLTGFCRWAKTTIQERSKYLLKLADLMEAQLELFAEMESRDQGKPISVSRTIDIPRAVYNFRIFGTKILHHLEM